MYALKEQKYLSPIDTVCLSDTHAQDRFKISKIIEYIESISDTCKENLIGLNLAKCSEYGKEVNEITATELEIEGKEHYFYPHHIRSISQRSLSKLVLSKTFTEVSAIGTGLGE